ncbi:MAG TPA: SIS domain-containing protein [Candidatus Competibacteraceae bacterium]|nr:SIS domain-containing protein [Candidatus Competibacteraceae bacterium]
MTSLTLMAQEIQQAPAVVARQLVANRTLGAALGERLRRLDPPVARGSSDHAATFAKYLIETVLGMPTASAGLSVAFLYRRPQRLQGTLVLVISQSGKSPDLVHYAETARAAGALVVALVNVTDSPLAAAAEVVLPLHAGPERSLVATKSFVASLAALLQLVAAWSADPALAAALEALSEPLENTLHLDWSAPLADLVSARDLLVIGRGLGFAIAQKAALKLKETSALQAEAFSAAEVMHGPLALVEPDYPILAFRQGDATEGSVASAVALLRDKGAQVCAAEPGPAAAGHRPLPQILGFYRLAEALARARGRDPDRPPHLHKVTEPR